MINSSDTIGNRTRDLPACSAVAFTITWWKYWLSQLSYCQKKNTAFREMDLSRNVVFLRL